MLFSIGLCIQLWDTHKVVALPAICVAGAAIGFYICSSLAAIVLDFFPYPTIISRLCRAEIVGRSILQLGWLLRYLPVWTIGHIVQGLSVLFDRLTDMDTYVGSPAYDVRTWLRCRSFRLEEVAAGMKSSFPGLRWGIKSNELKSNNVTSLALSWLIKNCEVPQSVDVALQAIAGANKDFFRGPLQECNAAMEISRRLASSNLYKDNNAATIVRLYSRALSFLGTSTSQGLNGTQLEMGGDL